MPFDGEMLASIASAMGVSMNTRVELPDHRRVFVDVSQQDRIRDHSPDYINDRIEREIADNVRHYARSSEDDVSRRISELESEWDIDRATMMFFSVVGAIALTLGTRKNKKFLGLLGIQLPFLAWHAFYGWCPPVALLRRLGFRSSKEIDAEKYALKTLRGDFARA